MKLKYFVLVCVTLVVVASLVLADEDEGKKKKGKGGKGGWMKNMKCKGEAINHEAMTKGKKDCWKENKPTAAPDTATEQSDTATEQSDTATEQSDTATEQSGDKKKKGKGRKGGWKGLCMKACTWKKQEVLNADGDYDSAGAETYIKSVFPAAVHTDMKAALDKCASEIGDTASRTPESKCEGYKSFNQCSKKAFFTTCKVEMPKKGDKKDGETAEPEEE